MVISIRPGSGAGHGTPKAAAISVLLPRMRQIPPHISQLSITIGMIRPIKTRKRQGGPGNGVLDPISAANNTVDGPYVEDKNDNGVNDSKEYNSWSALYGTANQLDGDLYVAGVPFTGQLSPFDIDKNGYVELPVASDSTKIDRNYEYTMAQVIKHTITHETGHAVGLSHTQDATCVMYEYSNNWSRDGNFSDIAKAQILIHNR